MILYHGTNIVIRQKHTDVHGFLDGIKYEKGETFQYAFCTERAVKLLTRQ